MYNYWKNICIFTLLEPNLKRGIFHAEHLNITHKQGHVTLNMFGWMWRNGLGELALIEGRFNSE